MDFPDPETPVTTMSLSRGGDAGDDDEFVTREFQGDVLQVVLAGTLYDQVFHCGYFLCGWCYRVAGFCTVGGWTGVAVLFFEH